MGSDMSDACQASVDNDLDSLHSLFSEPDTGSQSDFSEADGIASAGSVSTCSIEGVSSAGSCRDAKAFEENTLQTIPLDCPLSPDGNRYDQRSGSDAALCANSEASGVICESTSYCDDIKHLSSPQPRDTSLEGSLSFCGPTQSPSQCNIFGHGGSSGVVRIQDGLRPSGHTFNRGEMLLGQDDPEPQVDSFHPYSMTDVPRCTSAATDSPKYLASSPIPPFSEEDDLPPDTCTGLASPARLGSPQLSDSFHGLTEEPLNNSCHPNVHYTETTDGVASPELDRVSINRAINLDVLEACPPVSSPREVDVDVQDLVQRPGVGPKDLDVLLAAVPLDGPEPDAEFQLRQELSGNRDGNSNVPVRAAGLPSNDPQAAPATPNSVSLRPFREGYLEFSHVEIQNCRSLEETKSSVKTSESTTNRPISSCCHSRDTSRAWRLDGSMLSIDIQHADFPLSIGKSSFHVFDGQVIQTLTIVHGPVEAFLSRKPAPSTKISKEKRKLSCPAAAAAPLTSKQKQYLMDLRDGGHT